MYAQHCMLFHHKAVDVASLPTSSQSLADIDPAIMYTGKKVKFPKNFLVYICDKDMMCPDMSATTYIGQSAALYSVS